MKTFVIAGGNSGMGKAAAIELAKKGYHIIIHGRDAGKTQQALEEIKTKSGNSNIEAIAQDVSSIDGMKKLVASIQQKTDVIDGLILSTGAILNKRIETPDGLELTFVSQYLCRFALVMGLMPQLSKSKFARIVQVGAPVSKKARIFFDDLALKNNFSMLNSMFQSMLANHLFVMEFAKRNTHKNVVMNILHVGIAKTGITRGSNWFMRFLVSTFGKSPAALTGNIVYLADDESVDFTGYYLKKPRHPEVKEKEQLDESMAARLWETSLSILNDNPTFVADVS